MLHTSLERDKHHQWLCTRVCAERIHGPSQRIRGGRWWLSDGHHADGRISYTEPTNGEYSSRNFSTHCSGDQLACSKPNCHATTVCCIHHAMQHNLPACANSTAPHYSDFYPKLCNVPSSRNWRQKTWRSWTWLKWKFCTHRRATQPICQFGGHGG